MFFCDGSGRKINERIAPDVYARLITSAGTKFGQPVVHDGDF
jgi:hypothetical protein